MTKKSCFVVSRIGDEGSDVRRQADCVLEYIIKPAAEKAGYDVPVRVDNLDKPTHITTEIVQNLINADLVVADLSGSNANVFYELGIRHAFQKPCIMLSNWDPAPPFDVSGNTIIRFVHDDPTSHKQAISRIVKQIESFEKGEPVSNPVTIANGYTELSRRGDEKDVLLFKLYNDMAGLSSRVEKLQKEVEYHSDMPPLPSKMSGLMGLESPNLEVEHHKPLNYLRAFSEPNSDTPSLGDLLSGQIKGDTSDDK